MMADPSLGSLVERLNEHATHLQLVLGWTSEGVAFLREAASRLAEGTRGLRSETEVVASYVIGGWSKPVRDEHELFEAIEQGRRVSPIDEVSVRSPRIYTSTPPASPAVCNCRMKNGEHDAWCDAYKPASPAATSAAYAQESDLARNNGADARKKPLAGSWAVEVRSDGETVVTIEDRCLSGRDLSQADKELIRHCAGCLLGFLAVGAPSLHTELEMRHARKQSHADGYVAGRGAVLSALGLDRDRRDDDELNALQASERLVGTELEVLRDLRRAIDASGSQKAVAKTAGVTQQFLTDVLKGRRAPSGALLAWLGYERVILYRKPGVSASERPAQTCATCRFLGLPTVDEPKAWWCREPESPLWRKHWKQEHSAQMGCVFHEPAPPGPVAQEKDK